MAHYSPPNVVPIFNPVDFQAGLSNLTQDEADGRYLKLAGGTEVGPVSFLSNISCNTNISTYDLYTNTIQPRTSTLITVSVPSTSFFTNVMRFLAPNNNIVGNWTQIQHGVDLGAFNSVQHRFIYRGNGSRENQWAIGYAGSFSNILTLNANGQVGINTSTFSSTQKLHVNGNTSISGLLTNNYNRIALGSFAGFTNQANNSVAIGLLCGATDQGDRSVAIGYNSGGYKQGVCSVSLGTDSGSFQQANSCVAIGFGCATQQQSANSVAIGYNAGRYLQGADAVCMGYFAGCTGQGPSSVAVGFEAGMEFQNTDCVAVGSYAGQYTQGFECVAVGHNCGAYYQANSSVAIGTHSGYEYQGAGSTAVGYYCGSSYQSANSVAVGHQSGLTNQGEACVAVGYNCGQTSQDQYSTAIGFNCGRSAQQSQAVAVGSYAGEVSQGSGGVAIGNSAGQNNQGKNAVAIGKKAGQNNQHDSSICINAVNNLALDSDGTSRFYVAPVRNATGNGVMSYNSTTKEITYSSSANIATITTTTISQSTPPLYIKSRTTNQVISTGTWTIANAIVATSVNQGSNGIGYHANGTFENISGSTYTYHVDYTLNWGVSSTNSRESCILTQSTCSPPSTKLGWSAVSGAGGGGETSQCGSGTFVMPANSRFTISVWQNSGGNLNLQELWVQILRC